MFYRHRPPHRYWSPDRAFIVEALAAATGALARASAGFTALGPEPTAGAAEYHAAQLSAGCEESVANAGSLRKALGKLLPDPVLLVHVGKRRRAAQGSDLPFPNDAARGAGGRLCSPESHASDTVAHVPPLSGPFCSRYMGNSRMSVACPG